MKRTIKSKDSISWFSYIFVGVFTVLCLLPIWLSFSVSISNEQEVIKNGFSLIPLKPTLDTYKFLIANKSKMIINAYGITVFTVIVGTLFSLTVTTCYAYAASLSKSIFKYSNALSFFAWFTMVFNGGMLPWYILTTKYYHLQNNLYALFVPYAMNVFYMFILRSNFRALSVELTEAAKIDGASNSRLFITIVLPLSKVGLVTITLFYVLQYWNDFYLSLMLVTNQKLFPMQKLLYMMMSNIQYLASGGAGSGEMLNAPVEVPMTTVRMAMTCLSIAPVLLFYPFAQKYFVKGVTIGAVKG